MSQLQSEGVTFVRTILPNVDINKESNKVYAIVDGPQESNALQAISNSFNGNTINIEANPPNQSTFIGRRVPIEIRFKLIFTGQSGGAGQTLLQAPYLRTAPGISPGVSPYDAPRSMGLLRAYNSIQCKLGDSTIASNINAYFPQMLYYFNNQNNRTGYESTTPSMLDNSWSYSNTFGTLRNPMLGRFDLPEGVDEGRGGYIDAIITRNDSTGLPGDVAWVELTCREPIPLSPFVENGDLANEAVDFLGLSSMSFIFSLGGKGNSPTSGLISSLWSHNADSPSVISSGTVEVISSRALFNYKTPDPTMMLNFRDGFNYAYYNPTYYPTSYNAPLAPDATTTITQNNIQLSSVPNVVYLSVSLQDRYYDITSSDWFLAIENINITFDNRSALLSTCTPIDIYNISRSNSNQQSWAQFSNDQGSVVALRFGKDISLGSSLCPGTQGNFSFQAKVTCRNQTNFVLPGIQLNLIVVEEGTMNISNNHVITSIGPIGRQDVLNSKNGSVVQYHPPNSIYGSGFLDKLKSMWNTIGPWARKGIDLAQKIIPSVAPQYQGALQFADTALKATGQGLLGGRRYRKIRGRGGQLLNRNELNELLDE